MTCILSLSAKRCTSVAVILKQFTSRTVAFRFVRIRSMEKYFVFKRLRICAQKYELVIFKFLG